MEIKDNVKNLSDYLINKNDYIEQSVITITELISKTIKNKGKIIAFGNGGSASDAQHLVCEFVGTFLNKERVALPAVCLNTNVSNMTSISNDLGYENIFSRQIESLCNKNDLVIGYSTSGNSNNVIKAIEAAKIIGAVTISITGKNGGRLKEKSDYNINVTLDSTPRIQEVHGLINHLVCEIIDVEFS